MSTINAVLIDAEEQEMQLVPRRNVERDWLEKLRDVVYEADDLFDRIASVAQRKRLMSTCDTLKEVLLFYSRSNQLAFARNASREVKMIRERLDSISKDHRDFFPGPPWASGQGRVVAKRREESHSFVYAQDVIGRDADKEAIIYMLLNFCDQPPAPCHKKSAPHDGPAPCDKPPAPRDQPPAPCDNKSAPRDKKPAPRDEPSLSPSDKMVMCDKPKSSPAHFVTLVGIGGLGKTTLAQSFYHDYRIVAKFPLRMWVCVSDEFNLRDILCKLLNSTRTQHLEVEELQHRVRQKIDKERYLLVLDDVWNEDRHEWLKLENLLVGGEKGSSVVVTSRSKRVAAIIGDGLSHELKGLSPKDSWSLFEKMAFRNEKERMDDDLIDIGQHVLKKCANVPLAIRVVGSLLYGQTKSTWQTFRNLDLINMKRDDKDGVLPILKLSYHHLTLQLKNCFNYCVLFPKNYWIEKEILVNLWVAYGFLSPSEGQRVQDAAEECFMILLQRCFFQDAIRDDNGEIVKCKLHDLMHDVAQEAVGRDILVVDNVSELKKKIRHLSFSRLDLGNSSSSFSEIENIRTLFKLQRTYSVAGTREIREFLKKARYLRVLCLTREIKTLPKAIDKLIHLRYLDLSHNHELEFLPATLCKLNNLQTLILKQCLNLKELPTKLSNLEKLRCLDIEGCRLDHMPPRFSNLTCLEKLTQFVVSHSQVGQANRGTLQDLEALTNVGGTLTIRVHGFSTCQVTKGAKYVSGMTHLKGLHIELSCLLNDDASSTLLLECLQPSRNVKHFNLSGYEGVAFPKWESIEDLKPSLPNLVELSLSDCSNLQYLPLLSQLRHLKTLNLINLANLEDIENCDGEQDHQPVFFPDLEKLYLVDLQKLKRWQKSPSESKVTSLDYVRSPVANTFPCLIDLNIRGCPYMTSIPLASSVRSLILSLDAPYSESFMMSSCCLTGSGELTIKFCNNEDLKSLSIVEELFRSHLSTSLCSLHIKGWPYLTSLCGGGLEHLTALQTLHLSGLRDLEELEDGNHSHLPWKFLTNLRDLELLNLPKLVYLPQGIQHLVALQYLRVEECPGFKLSAKCASRLTSVKFLFIYRCDGLNSLPKAALSGLPSLEQVEIKNCELLEDWVYELSPLPPRRF
uniref:Uncharacterized protein n=2 Tax=Chenopodium quinoa TaxID=63459 RepID=A0A803MDN3_CHEQI